MIKGVSGGGLRGLEHPPKVWHNSQLSSCVTTIVSDKQQLVAKTSNKLTALALNGSFSSLLGLKQLLHASLSSNCLQERVNEGRGRHFGGVAKSLHAHFARVWLSTSLLQTLDTPLMIIILYEVTEEYTSSALQKILSHFIAFTIIIVTHVATSYLGWFPMATSNSIRNSFLYSPPNSRLPCRN